MSATDTIRFYFSFRSPYAWLAAERWEHELGPFAEHVELLPFYPTAETFPNDPVRIPNKLRYIAMDIVRLCKAYGLVLKGPPAIEADWGKAHAAFLGAARVGRGQPFMLEMFRARWSLGQDVGLDSVIADAAARANLDRDMVLAAGHDPVLQTQIAASFQRGQDEDGIFGAPSFVYKGQLFWGHDRLSSLRAEMDANAAGAA